MPSVIKHFYIMASSTSAEDDIPAPSRAQLALALAIAKYKPANVDIQGYTLRSGIS